MNGHHDRVDATPLAFEQDRLHRIVIRMEPLFDACRPGGCTQAQVTWNHRAIACLRYQIRRREVAIAVDDQARCAAQYGRGVEDFGERLGDTRRTNVPRNVPVSLRGRQPEVVELLRDGMARVIAQEDKGPSPLGADHPWCRHPISSLTVTVTSMPMKASGEPS
jgi:hypothetical protein